MKYYSQTNQDKYLNESVFKGKTEGYFVDIGAHDGVTYNNSKFFEDLGWDGICVEPNPDVFKSLQDNRKCECSNVCVSSVDGEVDFLKVESYTDGEFTEMLSGVHNEYDPRHLARINREIKQFGGKTEVIKMSSKPLHELVDNNITIDFVSIDVEGAEYDIVKSIDFDKLDILCFCIENNYGTPDVSDYLSSKGYILTSIQGADEVFIKNYI